MNEDKQLIVGYAARCLGLHGTAACHVLDQLWDIAFEHGRLEALGELDSLADQASVSGGLRCGNRR
jgi:hypothetical protein